MFYRFSGFYRIITFLSLITNTNLVNNKLKANAGYCQFIKGSVNLN